MFSVVRIEFSPVRIKLLLTLTSVALTVGAVIRPDTTGLIVGSFVPTRVAAMVLSGLSASDALSTLWSPGAWVAQLLDLSYRLSELNRDLR